jgi:hypothetical protein
MTLDLATMKTAIKAWTEAQSGLTAQWRDEAGGWQSKTRIRLHLRSFDSLGEDWLGWEQDEELSAPNDLVPTVQGNRTMVLEIVCESRDQRGNNNALYYIEKLRTSLKKPSVRSILYGAGLVVTSSEASLDLPSTVDNRIESRAQLDIHLASVVNERDENEGDSFVETFEIAGEFIQPDDSTLGWDEEPFP